MGGRLALNVLRFARLLRGAGFPIGMGKIQDALAALEAVGVTRRDDVYWALHAVFVDRHDRHEVFDQAFRLFWRDPLMCLGGEPNPPIKSGDRAAGAEERLDRRLAEALGASSRPAVGEPAPLRFAESETQARDRAPDDALTARATYSEREVPGEMDFGTMSAEELEAAFRAIRRLRLPDDEVPTRRFRIGRRGSVPDIRASFARARQTGGEVIELRRRLRRWRQAPLVMLIDISGSMSVYSRILLRFLHRLYHHRPDVHGFVFGTRLTNVTRALVDRDADRALERVAARVGDWSGGTRIGPSLKRFNFDWSRRVLSRKATVLLVTDGLERDPGGELEIEMARLSRASYRLIWLNPHLRDPGYAPLTRGARAIRPYVTDFRPVHNLASLEALVAALSEPQAGGTAAA
jgi:uncharacterized protein with von Willebrand factor type A (vWA) domain